MKQHYPSKLKLTLRGVLFSFLAVFFFHQQLFSQFFPTGPIPIGPPAPQPTFYFKTPEIILTNLSLKSAGNLYTKSELIFYDCFTTPKLKKATLNLQLDLGEEYNYGDYNFKQKVEVQVLAYSGFTNTSSLVSIPGLANPVSLTIDKKAPRQLYSLDFTGVFNTIRLIEVKIVSITAVDAALKNALRLKSFFTEEYLTDVSGITDVTPLHISSPSSSNPQMFEWATCYGVPDFQFQLLRLFNKDESKYDITADEYKITDVVDWSKALTIETQSSSTLLKLTIAEGRGYYIWRVRPIGNYYRGGIANNQNWGMWSTSQNDGETVSFSGTTGLPDNAFFYDGLDEDINWIYSRTFTEGNPEEGQQFRISENMTYANGLQQVKQTQAHLLSNRKTLVSQTIQDYSGRPALSTMAAPLDQDFLQYKNKYVVPKGSTNVYTAADFDADGNYKDPLAVDSLASLLGNYYSDMNGDVNIPGAEGYPFTRSLFERDGTNRIKEQGGAGSVHRIHIPLKADGTDVHTTKTYYGGVADAELIRVFGDEAPNANSVHKAVSVDANGTASVSYVSKEGQTIATCLSIPGSSLLDPLPSQATATFTVTDTLRDKKPFGNNGTTTTKPVVLANKGDISYTYEITPALLNSICNSSCKTCDYKVYFLLHNMTDPDIAFPVDSLIIGMGNCSTAAFTKTGSWKGLNPGTYLVEKRVITENNDPAPLSTLSAYIQSGTISYKDEKIMQDTMEVGRQLRTALAPIEEFIADTDLVALNNYIKSQVNPFTNTNYNLKTDTFFRINTSCCTIQIPIVRCDDDCDVSSDNIDFEKMLFDKWNHAEENDLKQALGSQLNNYFYTGGKPTYSNVYPIIPFAVRLTMTSQGWYNISVNNITPSSGNVSVDLLSAQPVYDINQAVSIINQGTTVHHFKAENKGGYMLIQGQMESGANSNSTIQVTDNWWQTTIYPMYPINAMPSDDRVVHIAIPSQGVSAIWASGGGIGWAELINSSYSTVADVVAAINSGTANHHFTALDKGNGIIELTGEMGSGATSDSWITVLEGDMYTNPVYRSYQMQPASAFYPVEFAINITIPMDGINAIDLNGLSDAGNPFLSLFDYTQNGNQAIMQGDAALLVNLINNGTNQHHFRASDIGNNNIKLSAEEGSGVNSGTQLMVQDGSGWMSFSYQFFQLYQYNDFSMNVTNLHMPMGWVGDGTGITRVWAENLNAPPSTDPVDLYYGTPLYMADKNTLIQEINNLNFQHGFYAEDSPGSDNIFLVGTPFSGANENTIVYMQDELGNQYVYKMFSSNVSTTISNGTAPPVATGTSTPPPVDPFPNGGNGAFNAMINHMIADGYNCKQLYSCWKGLVESYSTLAFIDRDGTKSLNKDFDLLAAFLQCAQGDRTAYTGISNCSYGDCNLLSDGYGKGYLEYAYQYFRYDDDNRSLDCEKAIAADAGVVYPQVMPSLSDIASNSVSPWTTADNPVISDPATPMKNKPWLQLAQCSRSINHEFASIDAACNAVTNVNEKISCLASANEDTCNSYCEARYDGFVGSLIRMYHRKGMYVDSVDVAIIQSSNPPSSASIIKIEDIHCMANSLVEECKKGCTLSTFSHTDPYTGELVIDSVGSLQEAQAMIQSMTYAYELDLPGSNGSCQQGFKSVNGKQEQAELLASYLNRKLETTRAGLTTRIGYMNVYDAIKEFNPGIVGIGTSTQLCVDSIDPIQDAGIFDLPCTTSFGSSTGQCSDVNFGAIAVLPVSTWTYWGARGTWRSLLQWDINSIKNMGLEIESAVLHLSNGVYSQHWALSGSNAAWIYRVTSPWQENTVTWPTQPPYTTEGALQIPASTSGDQAYDIDVTSMFNYWITNPDANYGMILKLQTEQIYRMLYFASSEFNDVNLHPKLIIKYRCHCNIPSDLTVPVASSNFPSEFIVDNCALKYVIHAPSGGGGSGGGTTSNVMALTNPGPPTTDMTTVICSNVCGVEQCNPVCIRWFPATINPDDAIQFTPVTCEQQSISYIKGYMESQVNRCMEKRLDTLREQYKTMCISPDSVKDVFTINYNLGYHHYTLYYYDRAGNLVKTVPPAGVSFKDNAGIALTSRKQHPAHSLGTEYANNSLKQLLRQKTPDGGESFFVYDNKGQLRFSQNAQQRADGLYSYTLYDELGRIIEVGKSGQLASISPPTWGTPPPSTPADVDFSDPAKYADFASKAEQDKTFPQTGKSELTLTEYSVPAGVAYQPGNKSQRYLQNRVSHSFTDEDGNLSTTTDQVHTYYSYDPHGNVEWLVQDIPELGKNYISYEYDLVSNKVLKVRYNEGRADQFFHAYKYDADNRIKEVRTSTTNSLSFGEGWGEADARYEYYAHGPLKRMLLGEDKVQGMDYVYTLQGWLKAINDPAAIGNGQAAVGTEGRDAFGMTLGYYSGDFNRKYNTLASPFNANALASLGGSPLYNGNISSWTSNMDYATAGGNTQYKRLTGEVYRYDELNRIKSSTFNVFNATGWNTQPMDDYLSTYTYDANGNILTLKRNGYNKNGLAMDNFSYSYYANTNRLAQVSDAVVNDKYKTDIEAGQTATNYTYDNLGNLKSDAQEGIEKIEWTVYGKMKNITRKAGNAMPDLEFRYDANGNRIMKVVKTKDKKGVLNPQNEWDVTYYVRDASGNMMGTYSKKIEGNGKRIEYEVQERPIYGSNRIGEYVKEKKVKQCDDKGCREFMAKTSNYYTRELEKKEYEIKDHLGNVCVVVTDLKLSDIVANVPENFRAQIEVYNSYFAFGMLQPGRSWKTQDYRYGFNGKESDFELNDWQDYGLRIYARRLGRFLSVDPIAKEYPELTPYQFASNRPIDGIDKDGLEHVTYLYSANKSGQVTQLAKIDHSSVGSKGYGIEVQTILPNGKTVTSFIPQNAPPPPAKSIIEKGGDAVVAGLQKLDAVNNSMQGSTYGEMENSAPLQSAEGGVKANLQVAGIEGTVGGKVSDEKGSEKSEAYGKVDFSTQTSFSANVKGYLKLNLTTPSDGIKVKGSLNFDFFYIQAQTNINTGKLESIEFGVQLNPSDKPNIKATIPSPAQSK